MRRLQPTTVVIFCVCIGMALGGTSGCKARQRKASLSSEDSGPLSTNQLEQHLREKQTLQQAKVRELSRPDKIYFDGDDPQHDVWDYYIDTKVVRELYPGRVDDMRSHRDFFGVRQSQLQVCQPHDLVEPGQPQKGCYAFDNLMRYSWGLTANGKHLDDSRDWYVHIIRQRFGSDQPDMLRYVKNGDIAVYFHPENRSDELGLTLQWRSTHAATIMERADETGKAQLLTVDTPSGYARPFNGADDTPFHVFRFVPIGFETDDDAARVAREMNVRWGTLAFNKFEFEGDYRIMGSHMRTPADLQKFADGYLKVADMDAGMVAPGILPNMYCSWYTFTNLSLGWARPFTPEGLGAETYARMQGKQFTKLSPVHNFANGKFDEGYAVPEAMRQRFPRRNEFPLNPLTAPELVMAYLDRLVMPDAQINDPRLFKMVAMQKAAILNGLAQNTDVHYNFFVEPNERGLPADDTNKYNQEVVLQFRAFVEAYSKAAAFITNDDLAVTSDSNIGPSDPRRLAVIDKLNRIKSDIVKPAKALVRKELDQEGRLGRVGKRFVPPYLFTRHAEDHDSYYPGLAVDGLPSSRRERPVLVYVGTVIHEKYLRSKGQEPGSRKIAPIPSTAAVSTDLEIDKAMYRYSGCAEKEDGKGWEVFLTFVNGIAKACNEQSNDRIAGPKVKMNRFELEALRTMTTEWRDRRHLSQKDIFLRNTFGIDSVMMRRLLASWWNDPTKHFKPALYAGEASSIDSAVANLRLLLQEPVEKLAAQQADEDLYNNQGHPRLKAPVPCVKHGEPPAVDGRGKATCDFLAHGLSATIPEEVNNPNGID